MTKDIINLAVVNFSAVWGDKEQNLKRILEYIDAAALKGAQMVIFPETCLTGYDPEDEDMNREDRMQRLLSETIPGPATECICERTKRYGIYAVFGMPERDMKNPESVYNAAAVCGPEGLVGSCRKIHLPFHEHLWADAGDRPFIFHTPWGPVGLAICYDFYCFPEITRYFRAKGARLLLNCTAISTVETSGAGGFLGNLCLQYLAVNNDVFIASSNLCGKDRTSWFMGGSSILGPSVSAPGFHYHAGSRFLDPGADESGLFSATVDLSDVRHSFLSGVWGDGSGKRDWRPDQYIRWLRDMEEDDR
ncbi:MAG TPA: carbon-nitrogen hydrolase family protein [Candidatus Eisenbergiella merdigallinarum]|uniref:Carbon-nitrogen hydrolase family protein n=1 Tax=Candidatus Eisenbergiella merdigallinarum TaxID=2838552 RepID=A0A9D2SD16_9FIRM|nr:carbon-nitrogen hydrolase family protein [Candidatus Eisenbergiella merdigallinarum]